MAEAQATQLSGDHLHVAASWLPQHAEHANASAGALGDLRVSLRRAPLQRLLVGQDQATLLERIGLLYTLCGQTQSWLARTALHAVNTGVALRTEQAQDASTSVRLWFELLHELFWRLSQTWPQTLGLADDVPAFVTWRRRCLAALPRGATVEATQRLELAAASRALHQHLLTQGSVATCAHWLQMSTPEPTQGGGLNAAPTLPPPSSPSSSPSWLPLLEGQDGVKSANEDDTHAAQPGERSITTALTQRVRDAEAAIEALENAQPFPLRLVLIPGAHENHCQAWCWSARGLLQHSVWWQNSTARARRYEVLAPTDVNFAHAAPLQHMLSASRPQGLAAFQHIEEARRWLTLAVVALDPCVDFSITLKEPPHA